MLSKLNDWRMGGALNARIKGYLQASCLESRIVFKGRLRVIE